MMLEMCDRNQSFDESSRRIRVFRLTNRVDFQLVSRSIRFPSEKAPRVPGVRDDGYQVPGTGYAEDRHNSCKIHFLPGQ